METIIKRLDGIIVENTKKGSVKNDVCTDDRQVYERLG
jgi:hypothetical protein